MVRKLTLLTSLRSASWPSRIPACFMRSWTTLFAMALCAALAFLTTSTAFAECDETYVEVVSPAHGAVFQLGMTIDFEVEGCVYNFRPYEQDYFVTMRILDANYDLVFWTVHHLGEFAPEEELDYYFFHEPIDSAELGLGTFHFQSGVGPHWKLAPDDWDSVTVTIIPPYERWNILKRARFNTFHVSSDHITFDMVEKGMSSWSHFQKAAYMIGDEAYAGSRNYIHQQKAAREVLGIERLVPTHNKIGAEKLLCTTMIAKGGTIFHNRGKSSELAERLGARQVELLLDLLRLQGDLRGTPVHDDSHGSPV